MPKGYGRIGALALALFVLGCGPLGGRGEGGRVELVTGVPPYLGWDNDDGGCFLGSIAGPLVADEKYGTVIILSGAPTSIPVIWRPGFTAHRVGSEVQVLDPRGNPVATTGRSYVIAGGSVTGGPDWPEVPREGAFWACDFVRELP
jgi:hypothetical protein